MLAFLEPVFNWLLIALMLGGAAAWYWQAATQARMNRWGWSVGGPLVTLGLIGLLMMPVEEATVGAIALNGIIALALANLVCEIGIYSFWLRPLLTDVLRLPGTLYLYILRELLRILALSTTVLVMVIGFAVAIKPLSEGLLDPQRLVTYVLLVAPTLLVFIIPFCGSFSGTLVFHRMASENEIVACSASGLSYRAILLPVLFLGVVLTLSLFYMSSSVLPFFHRFSASIVQEDIVTMLVEKLRQGQSVSIDKRVVIFANDVVKQTPPKEMLEYEIPPKWRIALTGVAIGQRASKDAKLQADGTAEYAHFDIYDYDGYTWVTGYLENVVYFDYHSVVQNEDLGQGQGNGGPPAIRVSGQMFRQEKSELKLIRLRNSLRDDPRFLSWKELAKWREQPHRYDRVRDAKRDLIETLAATRLLEKILVSLKSPERADQVWLIGSYGDESYRYLIKSPVIERLDSGLLLRETKDEKVQIEQFTGGNRTRIFDAPRAVLSVEPGPPLQEPVIRIEMQDVAVDDRNQDLQTDRHKHEITGYFDGERVRKPLTKESPAELIATGRGLSKLLMKPDAEGSRRGLKREGRALKRASTYLDRSINKLIRKINAQLHQRAALATCCLLTLLIGTVLSIKLRNSMPLVVYLWAFMLAIVALLITYNGENFATDQDYHVSVGLIMIWTGTILLTSVLIWTYTRLAKN